MKYFLLAIMLSFSVGVQARDAGRQDRPRQPTIENKIARDAARIRERDRRETQRDYREREPRRYYEDRYPRQERDQSRDLPSWRQGN